MTNFTMHKIPNLQLYKPISKKKAHMFAAIITTETMNKCHFFHKGSTWLPPSLARTLAKNNSG